MARLTSTGPAPAAQAADIRILQKPVSEHTDDELRAAIELLRGARTAPTEKRSAAPKEPKVAKPPKGSGPPALDEESMI